MTDSLHRRLQNLVLCLLTIGSSASACVVLGVDEPSDPSSSGESSESTTSGNTDASTGTGTATTVTTTASTDSSSATETDADDSAGFVEDSGGSDCGYCDIWEPGECPEGEKCTFISCDSGGSAWDSYGCRVVVGEGEHGDPCTISGEGVGAVDDCAVGHVCLAFPGDEGVCLAHCTGDPQNPMCPSGSVCQWTGQDFPLCLELCDPLAQNCNAGQSCLPGADGQSFVCLIDASGGQGDFGTPCSFVNSCNPGLLCIDAQAVPEPDCATANGCCSPLCSLSGGEPCPGEGQICEPYYELMFTPEGYEDVGICVLPSP